MSTRCRVQVPRPSCSLVAASLLLAAAVLVGGPGAAPAQVTPPVPDTAESDLPPDPDSARALRATIEDGFTLAAVGDLIIARPISQNDDPRFARMTKILRGGDVTFGNLEESLIDIRTFGGHPQAEYGGTWLIGAPAVAEDLRRLGFDLLSRANNHTTDMGVEGMRATGRALDEVSLVHAGSGHDLAAARAGRYLETGKGTVGLVSIASTFTPMSRAMDPLGEAPGRPGLSALRTTRYVLVTPEEFASLKRVRDGVREALPEGAVDEEEEAGEGETEKELELFGVNYRVSGRHGFEYEMNSVDVQDFLRSVEAAKRNSDFVLATIHAHEPGNWSEEPADFLPELARRAIDAGADQFVAHGPHRLRGIDVYEGKPIFYSVGNFVFQNEPIKPVARDAYERFNTDPEAVTDPELNRRQVAIGFEDEVWYESVIAVSRYEAGQVATIRLHPVTMGFDRSNPARGVPRLARRPRAKEILKRLKRLSEPYGTTLEIEDGVGVIRVGEAGAAAGNP